MSSAPTSEWQSLSRWAVVHFCFRYIGQILGNLYAMVPLLVGAIQGGVYFIAIGVPAIVALLVTFAALRHRFFRYRLEENRIQVRAGILNKKQVTLEYKRIQNVSLEHPFYFRPFGRVTLKADSAGSTGEEVVLAALTQPTGESLREHLLAKKRSFAAEDHLGPDHVTAEHSIESADTTVQPGLMTLLVTRKPLDLVLHGITNNRAWVIAGFAAGAFGQASEEIRSLVASLGIDVAGTLQDYTSEMSMAVLALSVITLLALGLLVMALISILASLFSYYDYRLNATPAGYLETRGLATRREVNMEKSRVQVLAIEQNWLDTVIERMHVILEQISHSQVDQPLAASNTRIMVPSITLDESMGLFNAHDRMIPHVRDLVFTPVSIRYWTRGTAVAAAGYLGGALMIGIVTPVGSWLILPAAAVVALHSTLLFLRYKKWGVAVAADYLVVRKGLIGTDYLVIQASKLQRIALRESPLTRRRGLASVTLRVASRAQKIPLVPRPFAVALVNYCLYTVESSGKSWM